jgi:tetratricopeptide (TPR) repeat protein
MKSALSDFCACLGLPLTASDEEIVRAYRRSVTLLNPNRFPFGDRRAFRVSRVFSNYVLPAYTTLRYPELRREWRQHFQSTALAECRTVPRSAAVRALQSATSAEDLRRLYEEAVHAACEELHLDIDRFKEHVTELHRLNVAFAALLRLSAWRTVGGTQTGEVDRQLLLARALIESGCIARALHLLRSLRVPHERQADRHELLGHCYHLLGTTNLAVREFRAALQIDPERQGALHSLKKMGVM